MGTIWKLKKKKKKTGCCQKTAKLEIAKKLKMNNQNAVTSQLTNVKINKTIYSENFYKLLYIFIYKLEILFNNKTEP